MQPTTRPMARPQNAPWGRGRVTTVNNHTFSSSDHNRDSSRLTQMCTKTLKAHPNKTRQKKNMKPFAATMSNSYICDHRVDTWLFMTDILCSLIPSHLSSSKSSPGGRWWRRGAGGRCWWTGCRWKAGPLDWPGRLESTTRTPPPARARTPYVWKSKKFSLLQKSGWSTACLNSGARSTLCWGRVNADVNLQYITCDFRDKLN